LNPMPTQLYISLDSPNPEMFDKLDKPMRPDAWEKLMKSLDIMKTLKDKTRTTLRLTVIKDVNMVEPEKYAELFERADPKFVEVKAYVWVGASRERLKLENMPTHDNVKQFAEEICKYCSYKIIDESTPSRVVLLMKEDSKDRFLDKP
ncbi:4-demethylwyosine synthase TYW1, partial [Candidatus Woesearchaeota archaeon]|nr:4-demethylwyosine synthase TYW1 [Candidatus Woesearchaeota archaeon]